MIDASAARIAAVHLARAYEPDQVELFTREYKQKLSTFAEEVRGMPPKDEQSRVWRYANRYLQGSWEWLINWGRKVATWVIETRAITGGKAKAIEMAARTFIKATRPPRDVAAWWATNAKHAYLLHDAISWPERSGEVREDGVQEKLDVGPFVVHNTLHLTGPKLTGVVEVLQKVEQKIQNTTPSSLRKVLYGDVFVVGQLKQSRTLAWYFNQDDRVYLRPHVKVDTDTVYNIVHELGHRYWHKFLSPSGQRYWNTEFFLIKNSVDTPVTVPKVGDLLGLPVKGQSGEDLRVVAIKPNLAGDLRFHLASGVSLSYKAVYAALRENAMYDKFPTDYAATKATEFWAEAFALHILGTLSEEHEERFIKALHL